MKRDDPADQQRNPTLALLGDHVYFSQWHHVFQPSREDSHTVKNSYQLQSTIILIIIIQ